MNLPMIDQSSPWYLDSKYQRYWQMYTSCMFHAHTDALTRCKEVSDSTAATLYSMVKGPWPSRIPKSVFVPKRSKSKKSRNRRNRRERECKNKSKIPKDDIFILTDDDTLQVSQVEGMRIEDDESECFDEEYLQFMEQSLKHRLKYQQTLTGKDKIRLKNSESIETSQEIMIQDHPDDVRNREMKQLFGLLSGPVYAKETAMQLSFDRISTLHKPPLWPNIPLRL